MAEILSKKEALKYAKEYALEKHGIMLNNSTVYEIIFHDIDLNRQSIRDSVDYYCSDLEELANSNIEEESIWGEFGDKMDMEWDKIKYKTA